MVTKDRVRGRVLGLICKLFFRAKTRDLWLLTVGLTKQSAECRSCILFSITDFGLYAYGLQEILRDVSLYLNCVSAWCFLKIMYFYFLVSKRIHIVVLGQVQCRRQILQFFATMYIWQALGTSVAGHTSKPPLGDFVVWKVVVLRIDM